MVKSDYLKSPYTTKYLFIIPPPPLSQYSISCYAEMFTSFTCILLPYNIILYIIYLSLGGHLDSGYVIILREGLLTVGGIIIVMCII